MLARVLLLGLLALVGLSFPAWATGPANYPPGGSGSGVVANTCTPGDFFSAVDGSGNFTCATPAGSGDVTAVGDCTTGACFTGTTGSTLTGASGTSLIVNTDNNIYLSFDTDNNATSTGVVIGSNASGSSATPYVVVSDAATPNVTLRNATRLRFNDTSDDTNYVELVGPSGISSNFTFTLPSDDGTSNQFLQTNGSGVLTWATPSGSGNVNNTGTPVNNQIAVWTNSTTIEGDPKLTLSGSSLTLGDSAVDAGFTLATGLTGGTDPAIDFTNGQVDCVNCRFTVGGGTTVPDGSGASTRMAFWSDSNSITSDADMTYDNSTNTLTVPNVTGNASTATALASNPSDCASDTYATTIAASGNLTCATVTNAGLAGSIAMSKTLLTADAGVALSTNSLTTASGEQGFLASGALTCGASTNGKMQVHTTPLQYCDNAATPTLQYAAYGNSSGVATSATALAANGSNCSAGNYPLGVDASGAVESCTADDDVPEAADYSNLTAGTGITNSPTGTINATLGTAITSSEITDGEIVNADINASAAIALSKLANMSTDRLLGRDTAGSGAIEELTVGGGIEFTGTGIQRSALTGDVTASAGSNSTTIAANSVALTTDTTGNYAAGDAEAGKALYINATSCSAGVITASDGTPSCLTASSTPEFVSRVMTAGATLGNYAVVMADGSDDDEVIEATTSTTQILGCSQDSDGTTSTNPVEVAVAGIARCKADTTVTAGSLVKLGATGEFSLATTADKTWGRAVTDDDGAGSAYILLFDGAEGTIDHALDLWTSIPDLTSNTLSIINANPTVSMTSTGTLNGMNFAPAFTTSGIGLLTGFNFQPTYSHSSLVSQLYGFNMVGTYTSTDASAAMVASIMRNGATYTSSTANAEPFSSLLAVDDKPVVSFTAATTGTSTPGAVTTVTHAPAISINDPDGATGGLAAMTLTNDIGLTMSGTYTETSGTLAVTNRVGFQYNEVTNTSSATAITNNIGVDIAALGAAGATTNIGIRNADTTVYTPCTDDISSNTDYLAAPACTVVNLTAGGVRDLTAGTDQIANGVDGQIVTYFFSGSNSIAFNDGDNLNLTGTITLSAGDTLMLVYSSTTGDWMQLGTSNN